MTTTQPAPGGVSRHTQIGCGANSAVFHRPGSPWAIQVLNPDAPLSAERIGWEFDYLRTTYADLPELITPQRVLPAHGRSGGQQNIVVVKRFIDVDPHTHLLRVRSDQLPEPLQQQLAVFVTITRWLLSWPLADHIPDTGMPHLPDIIDDEFRNLAFDRAGHLRLLDTNQLISCAHLYEPGTTSRLLDLGRRRIHAKFFTRLLRLEILTGRDLAELMVDPLYRGYLTTEQITELLTAAMAPTATPRGEPR